MTTPTPTPTPYQVHPVADEFGRPCYYAIEGPDGSRVIRFQSREVAEWCRDLLILAYTAGANAKPVKRARP